MSQDDTYGHFFQFLLNLLAAKNEYEHHITSDLIYQIFLEEHTCWDEILKKASLAFRFEATRDIVQDLMDCSDYDRLEVGILLRAFISDFDFEVLYKAWILQLKQVSGFLDRNYRYN